MKALIKQLKKLSDKNKPKVSKKVKKPKNAKVKKVTKALDVAATVAPKKSKTETEKKLLAELPWYIPESLEGISNKKDTTKKRVRRTKEELKDVYIDPVEMEKLIIEYYETDLLTDKLAGMVQMIANRLALARNFYSYSFKAEMQGDAIIKMVTALRRKRFKCGSGYNPFSYFTKIAYHAFQNCIKKHKRDFDTLKRYQQEVYEDHVCSHNLSCKKNTKHHENYQIGD